MKDTKLLRKEKCNICSYLINVIRTNKKLKMKKSKTAQLFLMDMSAMLIIVCLNVYVESGLLNCVDWRTQIWTYLHNVKNSCYAFKRITFEKYNGTKIVVHK